MSRFYITKIAASGEGKAYSSIEFEDGVNIIEGPSNTGKSIVIACIDFMFGGEEVPFTIADTGYNTVSIEIKSDDGYTFRAERKIEEGENGERGSNTVHISTTVPGIEGTELKISTKEYSDALLKLLGIKERPRVIATQAPKDEDLTIRTIFHFFFLGEENIFEKRTPLDTPGHSKITKSLTALQYLINGDDLKRFLPEVSVKELEKRADQKAGVIKYLNEKIEKLSNQKKELEDLIVEDDDVNLDAKIEEFLAEIEQIDKEIVGASEESRKLLDQIFTLNEKLQEARFLSNRYKALRSQYMSDIKRLNFIVDGDVKSNGIKHKDSCPFCGQDMDIEDEDHTAYVESAKAEMGRIRLQLGDLETTESYTRTEIKSIEESLKNLNAKNADIMNLLNQKLRPRSSELRAAVAEYRRIQQVRQQLDSISYMSSELGTDVFEKENEDDEKAVKFDAKKNFDKDIWKELSDSINLMVKECAYTGQPESRLNINTADIVVGSKHKKNQGKGYRAFLNTIMLVNLMKYLETNGKYALRILVLDSPILSLKEKKYEIKENEKATAGMRESLIQYIIDNCGENQVIIAENELPENVDYTKANRVIFTMEENGRYGFLKSVRN
ncbi:MAG: AAA family ATPase [Agathobacter sp.]|nr:AAA family ATPase [Agathobacter sp.]